MFWMLYCVLYGSLCFSQVSTDTGLPELFEGTIQSSESQPLDGDSPIVIEPDETSVISSEEASAPPVAVTSNENADLSQKPQLNAAEMFKSIRFGFGKSQLSGLAKRQLVSVSSQLKSLPLEATVQVNGHTDNKGSEAHNMVLSRLRAMAVLEYLSEKNTKHRFTLVASGELSPVASNDTDQGRALNRRVDVEVGIPSNTSIMNNIPTAKTMSLENTAPPTPELTVEASPVLDEAVPEVDESVETEPVWISKTKENTSGHVIDLTENTDKIPTVIAKELPPQHKQHSDGHMISDSANRPQLNQSHAYDLRKRPSEGTSEVYIGPMFNQWSDLNGLGVQTNKNDSQLSWELGARWTSFMEDVEDTFITLDVFGRVDRFSANTNINLPVDERQWSYGGTFWAGRYLLDDLSVAAGVGVSREPYLKLNSGNLNYTSDFIGHLGIKSEGVAWRFSSKGDLGVHAGLKYFNIPFGDLDSGWQYGGGVFADYKDYRLSLNLYQSDFEALGLDTTMTRFSLLLSSYF